MTRDKNLNTSIKLDSQTAEVIEKKGYIIEKKLNEGAFGQVYKGLNTNTGDLIAVKVMELAKIGVKFANKFLPRELRTLIGIHHENLIYIYDIIRCNHRIYIFMEFANGGDLTGFLSKNGPMPESLACHWFSQVSRGLQYLHDELRIAHRDIKIDNVLLHNNTAQLTDFGFAKPSWNYDSGQPLISETFCGTEPYYSPLLVARKPYDAFAADIWAMGVMLFCMLNNKFVFHFADPKKMLEEQTNPEFIKDRYTKKFAADLKNLQEKMLDPDEKKRITISQVLEHPWIVRKGK